MNARNWRLLRISAFWAALLFSYVCALLPGRQAPSFGGSDKTDHIITFVVLTNLACAAYPRRPLWLLGALLSFYGAFIEISQGTSFIGRDADINDWIADTIAIIVGIAIAMLLKRALPRLYAS